MQAAVDVKPSASTYCEHKHVKQEFGFKGCLVSALHSWYVTDGLMLSKLYAHWIK